MSNKESKDNNSKNLKFWRMGKGEEEIDKLNYPTEIISSKEEEFLANKLFDRIELYRDNICFPKLEKFYNSFSKVRACKTEEDLTGYSKESFKYLKEFTFCWEKNKNLEQVSLK